jgi:hypothetical protein
MKKLRINSNKKVIEFLVMLIAENRVFHLDDMPELVVWSTPIDPETLDIISGNWNQMWHHCDPWVLLEKNPDLWAHWIGEQTKEDRSALYTEY